MTIKQYGGVFGRNPAFNNVDVEGTLTVNGEPISDFGTMAQQDADSVNIDGGAIDGTTIGAATPVAATFNNVTVAATTDATEELGRFSNNAETNRFLVEQQGSSGYALKSSVELRLHADYDDNTSAGASNIEMYTDAVQRMSIAGVTGDVTLDTGNLVIGTSGKGIDFSATAGTGTSELLDDYEEGVWDCVIKDAYTGNVGSTHTGNYTKIGKVVVITVVCSNITTVGLTAGNDIYFTGLPFSPAAVSSGSVSANDVVFTGYLSAQNAGAPYFRLSETASGATKGNVLVSQITSGSSDVWVQLTYEV